MMRGNYIKTLCIDTLRPMVMRQDYNSDDMNWIGSCHMTAETCGCKAANYIASYSVNRC